MAIFVDEILFAHVQERSNGGDIRIRQANIPLPAAARPAALASVYDRFRHGKQLCEYTSQGLRFASVICGGRT